jgi:Tol biopolymer transport system component
MIYDAKFSSNTLYAPKYSPDGSKIAFILCKQNSVKIAGQDKVCTLAVIDVKTGGIQGLLKGMEMFDLTWSPDGQWIMTTKCPDDVKLCDGLTAQIHVIKADGSELYSIPKGDAKRIEMQFDWIGN